MGKIWRLQYQDPTFPEDPRNSPSIPEIIFPEIPAGSPGVGDSDPTIPRGRGTSKNLFNTQLLLGCKIKMLVGYEGDKMFATIITTKEEVDYQFWYPGRNKVVT